MFQCSMVHRHWMARDTVVACPKGLDVSLIEYSDLPTNVLCCIQTRAEKKIQVLMPSYAPVAEYAFKGEWTGTYASEMLLFLGSLSLFSIFILIAIYWADLLKKVCADGTEYLLLAGHIFPSFGEDAPYGCSTMIKSAACVKRRPLEVQSGLFAETTPTD